MKEFHSLWKQSALIAALLGIVLAGIGAVTGSLVFWGLAAGIVPGEIDLIGLGLRLPLWARLNPRAAATGMNFRLLSRLVLLGIYFYVLKRFTTVNLDATLAGVFIPHLVYLVWAAFHSKGKGVNG